MIIVYVEEERERKMQCKLSDMQDQIRCVGSDVTLDFRNQIRQERSREIRQARYQAGVRSDMREIRYARSDRWNVRLIIWYMWNQTCKMWEIRNERSYITSDMSKIWQCEIRLVKDKSCNKSIMCEIRYVRYLKSDASIHTCKIKYVRSVMLDQTWDDIRN